ncbi:hypothetical protein [Facklamia sp. P12955]|uniref:hypothetical protein n=1 Tax=Facklamia sp. P12955 TaxID=3421946 RepID=UPI003D17DE12
MDNELNNTPTPNEPIETTANEHDPYAWYRELEEAAKRNNQRKEEEFKNYLQKEREKHEQQQIEVNKLFAKAIQRSSDEDRKQKQKEIEKEKQRVIEEVEKKYEEKGIKTEKTIKQEEALLKMIRGLNS